MVCFTKVLLCKKIMKHLWPAVFLIRYTHLVLIPGLIVETKFTDLDCKEFCNWQCLYSTDMETGFPLQELQGQRPRVHGSLLEWHRTTSLWFHPHFLHAITTKQLFMSRPWVECVHESEVNYPVCCISAPKLEDNGRGNESGGFTSSRKKAGGNTKWSRPTAAVEQKRLKICL